MKTSKIIEELSNVADDEEVICVWFKKEDFPLGLNKDHLYETLPTSDWNDVVSMFETTKWDNPSSSSWTGVHEDIYNIVGEKLSASIR